MIPPFTLFQYGSVDNTSIGVKAEKVKKGDNDAKGKNE